MAAAKRNTEVVLSIPVADDAALEEGRRVTIDSNGQLVYASATEAGIGTLPMYVAGANQAAGYAVGAVQLSAIGKHAITTAAGSDLDAGDVFYAAADGKISDTGTIALGIVEVGAAAGAMAQVIFFAPYQTGAVVALDATSLTLSAGTHGGKIVRADHTAAECTITLPAATGSGNRFTVAVGSVNTNGLVIECANASDTMKGNILTNSTGDTPDLGQPWPTAADSDTITLNGTTSGGAGVGDYVELIDFKANVWMVRGITTTSGTEETPFSAAVS